MLGGASPVLGITERVEAIPPKACAGAACAAPARSEPLRSWLRPRRDGRRSRFRIEFRIRSRGGLLLRGDDVVAGGRDRLALRVVLPADVGRREHIAPGD